MGSVAANTQKHYSFEALLALEEISGQKHELLDGQVVAMTGGTKAHNLIALGLFREIDQQKAATCRLYVADVKLRITPQANASDHETVSYPDLMLACAEETSELYEDTPLLLAEVLSDSTVWRDKGHKRDRYLSVPSLQVYLLLSQTDMLMTVYHWNGDGWKHEVYLRHHEDIVLHLGDEHPPLQVNMQRIYQNLVGRI